MTYKKEKKENFTFGSYFPFSYCGNKSKELKFIDEILNKQKINFDNIETIVEPFAGSFIVSYHLWKKYPNKKFKFIYNDNNAFLIELLNILSDEQKTNDFINEMNNWCNRPIYKPLYNEMKKEGLKGFILSNKYFGIRIGLFDQEKDPNSYNFDYLRTLKINDFLRSGLVSITSEDGVSCYERYKTDEKAFIYLDPPYVSSENSYYASPGVKIYEYLHKNNYLNENAKILINLELMWIISLLFDINENDENILIYEKVYNITKRKTKHVLLINSI